MAGGTDLLGVLKDRILPEYPDALINLKTIPGMDFINKGPDGLTVGAMTTLSEIACSPHLSGRGMRPFPKRPIR
jgi:CO/xanthine dehydrogenase FAD-binding subunit